MRTFRQEMQELVLASIPSDEFNNRNVEITFRHFGWDGKGGCSMQEVGDQHLLTRERVRQISSKCSRQMAEHAEKHLTSLPALLATINKLAPAKAERIEQVLRDQGLGEDLLEGVLTSAKQFNRAGKHLRVMHEFGERFVILPDMEGSAAKVLAKAQKLTSRVGMTAIHDLLYLVPGIPEHSALDYIRDVLSIRQDAIWLNEEKTWVWLSNTTNNRLITCLHKLLSIFSSVTLEGIRQGANRYFRKGDKTPAVLKAPQAVMANFLKAWGQASCSDAGIVRKSASFQATARVLDYERLVVEYIVKRPSKMAREKELENVLVPASADGVAHEKKRAFSNAINYSPIIAKGKKRGEYVANGAL